MRTGHYRIIIKKIFRDRAALAPAPRNVWSDRDDPELRFGITHFESAEGGISDWFLNALKHGLWQIANPLFSLSFGEPRVHLEQCGDKRGLISPGIGEDDIAHGRRLANLLAMTISTTIGAIDVDALFRQASARRWIRNAFGNRVGRLQMADLHLRSQHEPKP